MKCLFGVHLSASVSPAVLPPHHTNTSINIITLNSQAESFPYFSTAVS